VFDGLDRCPDTPAGQVVDATGCPRDSDRDGVPDLTDQCPGTPAGVPVNPQGCPIVGDADGDAVEDRRDRCPNTPRNTPVDQVGCPILFRGTGVAEATLILRGVNFQTGRSALTASSYTVLDQVAASLVANPEIRIEIAGYTDNVGSGAVNRRLSLARAASVRAYLARRGVRPDRMVIRGYGPTNPVATNTTAAGRAQNRRTELHRLP
jgi:OOP family OmpA-OmpF porin